MFIGFCLSINNRSKMVYAFGKYAEEYGKFLEERQLENLIKKIDVIIKDIKNEQFVRQVYSHGFDIFFNLDGVRELYGGHIRGVLKKPP